MDRREFLGMTGAAGAYAVLGAPWQAAVEADAEIEGDNELLGAEELLQIFENNRLGYYRLDIEPARISLNLENLKSHPDYELRHIAEELTLKKVS